MLLLCPCLKGVWAQGMVRTENQHQLDNYNHAGESFSLLTSEAHKASLTINLKVFPNPAQAVIYVETALREYVDPNLFRFSIADNHGSIMMERSLPAIDMTAFEINVANLPTGIYWFNLHKGEEFWTEAFVKE